MHRGGGGSFGVPGSPPFLVRFALAWAGFGMGGWGWSMILTISLAERAAGGGRERDSLLPLAPISLS